MLISLCCFLVSLFDDRYIRRTQLITVIRVGIARKRNEVAGPNTRVTIAQSKVDLSTRTGILYEPKFITDYAQNITTAASALTALSSGIVHIYGIQRSTAMQSIHSSGFHRCSRPVSR